MPSRGSRVDCTKFETGLVALEEIRRFRLERCGGEDRDFRRLSPDRAHPQAEVTPPSLTARCSRSHLIRADTVRPSVRPWGAPLFTLVCPVFPECVPSGTTRLPRRGRTHPSPSHLENEQPVAPQAPRGASRATVVSYTRRSTRQWNPTGPGCPARRS